MERDYFMYLLSTELTKHYGRPILCCDDKVVKFKQGNMIAFDLRWDNRNRWEMGCLFGSKLTFSLLKDLYNMIIENRRLVKLI